MSSFLARVFMQRPGEVKLVKEVYLALCERLCIVGFAGADEALAVNPCTEREIGRIFARDESMAVALIIGGEALVHLHPWIVGGMAGGGIKLRGDGVEPVAQGAWGIALGFYAGKAM